MPAAAPHSHCENGAIAVISQLDPAGPSATHIERLWWVLLALGALIYVVIAAITATALRRRRSDLDGSDDRAEVPTAVARRWIVNGGVILPAVVLPLALGVSVATMRTISERAPTGSLSIEIVGYQWWWSVHYRAEQITTANEIHIPVGEPVELRLSSADVIHSFWVPQLAGKIDAFPNDTNILVVQADEPGTYRGQCAEFCGLQHAKMGLLVIAQPRADFESWIAQQQQPARPSTSEDANRGQTTFLRSGCGNCHRVRGTSTAPTVAGPDLTHVASRQTLAAGAIANTADRLAHWLVDPDDVKQGTAMPPTNLSEEELAAVVAYLQSLE